MSGTTLILILKSLWPFIKEILLKDKGLKAWLSENLIATFLSGCLLFLFLLFMYTASLADKYFDEARTLKGQLATRDETITTLKTQLGLQVGQGAPPVPQIEQPAALYVPPPVVAIPPEQQQAQQPQPPPAIKPSRPPVKKKPDNDLRSYAESVLKKYEQDGN